MIQHTRVLVNPYPNGKPWYIISSSVFTSLNHVLYQIAKYTEVWPKCSIRLYPCDTNFPENLHKSEVWAEAMTYDEYMEYLE